MWLKVGVKYGQSPFLIGFYQHYARKMVVSGFYSDYNPCVFLYPLMVVLRINVGNTMP